jgi:hypothetical protein
MQLLKPILTLTLGLLGLAQAEPIHKRATDGPIGKLYAYGTNISALPLFVADGTAYLGNVSLSTISGASNVTCKFRRGTRLMCECFEYLLYANAVRYVSASGEIIAHHQHTNISGTTTNSTENYLSIDTASGASNPVLIEAMSSKADYTTENFYVYGTQIVWRDPAATIPGTMEANFYAIETDVDGIWKVYWDADSSAGKKGTLVVLKSVPS